MALNETTLLNELNAVNKRIEFLKTSNHSDDMYRLSAYLDIRADIETKLTRIKLLKY
jgi:hypothetical protein